VLQEINDVGIAGEVVVRVRRYDDKNGKVIQWCGTATDIEDRKRSESLLNTEKRMLSDRKIEECVKSAGEFEQTSLATKISGRQLQTTIDTIPVLAWSAEADGSAAPHYILSCGFKEALGMELLLPMTCLRAQESRTRSTGRNFLPKGVKEYSTRTGISGNSCRFTSSSRSSSRNCCVNTFCEIRGMFLRRALKRSGSLDSESHQRITGFQRPPIKTSRCSIGHSLAINLALITPPVTRYPFGAWYLLDGIKRDYMPARMNSKNDARNRTPTADLKLRMSRSPRQNEILHHQGHQEHHPGIGRTKLDKAASASLFGIWDELLRFRHAAWCGDFYTAHRPESIPLVHLHQRRKEKWLKLILVQNVVKRGC